MGMYMIFCSLPFSLFFYKGVYGVPYFSELHSLVLFIVLGVGADDVFVLVDSWKDTAVMYPGNVVGGCNRLLTHRRLFHCYEHTMGTVFNTSFTTAMAFISTGFSPLMPIATFGWYAATCIVANYLFCITLMPPVVVLHSLYFSSMSSYSTIKSEDKVAAPTPNTVTPVPPGELEMIVAGADHNIVAWGMIRKFLPSQLKGKRRR